MVDLEAKVKAHPLVAWLIIVLLGVVFGTGVGWLFAFEATRSITEAAPPNDPLDMLHVVAGMYLGLGFFGGAIVGLFTGSIVYFANRQRGSRHLNS